MHNEVHKRNIAAIITASQGLLIKSIRVEFDGGGDEGGIEEPAFTDAQGATLSEISNEITVSQIEAKYDPVKNDTIYQPVSVTCRLGRAVSYVVEEMIAATGVNWYDGEGGFGHWELDVESGELDFAIETRFVETETAHSYCGDFNEYE